MTREAEKGEGRQIRNKAPASLQVPCFFDSQRDFSVDGMKGAGKPGVDFLFTSILPQKATSDEPFGAANSYERVSSRWPGGGMSAKPGEWDGI